MAGKNATGSKIPLLIIELIGLGISIFLFLISQKIIYKGDIPCPRGTIFACHSVLRGKYSSIGPFVYGGIQYPALSIAGMGVAYYLFHLIVTMFGRRGGFWYSAKLIGAINGLLFVAFLRSVEILTMHKICVWCYGVALVTIVQAILFAGLASPPLPRMKWGKRTILVIVVFALMLGGTVLLGSIYKHKADSEPESEAPEPAVETPKQRSHDSRETPKAEAPRTGTPKPKPPKQQTSVTSGSGTLTKRGQGKKTDGVPQTEETRLLKAHGWTLAATEADVIQHIKTNPCVLLFVYDPDCGECQAFTHGELITENVERLPAKRVAINESKLEGPLSRFVENVPALLVFNQQQQLLFKHEGRMTLEDMMMNITPVMPMEEPPQETQ